MDHNLAYFVTKQLTHLYFEEVGFIVQFPSQSLIINTALAFCIIVVDCVALPSLGRHGSEDVTRFGVKCGQFWSGTVCSPTQMKREAFDVTNWDLWSDFLSRDKGEQANSDDEFLWSFYSKSKTDLQGLTFFEKSEIFSTNFSHFARCTRGGTINTYHYLIYYFKFLCWVTQARVLSITLTAFVPMFIKLFQFCEFPACGNFSSVKDEPRDCNCDVAQSRQLMSLNKQNQSSLWNSWRRRRRGENHPKQ